jgi:dihydroneopterin aldolase
VSHTPVRLPGLRSEAVRPTGLKVFVRALTIEAFIGVHAHERGRTQPLVVDVELDLGERTVERIADTVNYEVVVKHAREIAASGHVDLVEEYAERLARSCLEDPRVLAARVRVEKPEALGGAEAAGCEVVFVRERP